MKLTNLKRPALYLFLLVLILQGAAASAMGSHVASEPVAEASPIHDSAAGDCHFVSEALVDHSAAHESPAHESHHPSLVDEHSHALEGDHAAHGDCCSADGDCSPGHCSATVALAQVNVSLLPWTAIQSSSLGVPQVRAPHYPLYRPPISA